MGVNCKVNILGQLILFAFERTHQQVIHTFVPSLIIIDVAKVDVNIDTYIVEAAHIFFKFHGRQREKVRAIVNRFIRIQLAQVVPVAVKQQHHILDVTTLNDILQILGKPSVLIPNIEDTLDGQRRDAVFTGLFRLLFSFLDHQRLDGK